MTGKNETQQHPAIGQQPDASFAIYHKLKKGVGHELVNDANVHELILMAAQYGDTLTETLLREWQSSCGDDKAMDALKAARH